MNDERGVISKLLIDSFRDQQSLVALKKDQSSKSGGMRWHPLMIRCLYLWHQPQKAYKSVHDVLPLLSQGTFSDYTLFCASM